MNIDKPTAIQRSVLANLLDPNPDIAARDVFIQSQTGSGKTLSFLLPILQDLLPLSSLSYIDRSIGTLAVIIAPTRELAKQISDVLEALLKLRLRPEGTSADAEDGQGGNLTRWLVSGLLVGGSTKTHEKARIRKGLPIIVATPGRLLDHLQNTESLNVGKCRWLVLDEADRLMELGFEESITGIIKGLDGRRKLALNAVEEGKSMEVGGWDWERRRRTVLCSATIREDVQKLAGTTLVKPLMVKAITAEGNAPVIAAGADTTSGDAITEQKLTPPSQLTQKYVVVPLKLRLVALIALLRSLVSQQRTQGSRIIVFLSCTDSVDFHWTMLGGTTMGGPAEEDPSGSDSDESDAEEAKGSHRGEQVEARSPLLPGCSIFRLHGSLPTPTRLSSLNQFTGKARKRKEAPGADPKAATSSILLCTSVASRGLDLPLVHAVVQADLPTEGGATEYVHRIGRTARAGKGGEAWCFVSPSESEWVGWVSARMQDDTEKGKGTAAPSLGEVGIESVLCSGFSCKSHEYEDRATQIQLACERWVLRRKEVRTLPHSIVFRSLSDNCTVERLPRATRLPIPHACLCNTSIRRETDVPHPPSAPRSSRQSLRPPRRPQRRLPRPRLLYPVPAHVRQTQVPAQRQERRCEAREGTCSGFGKEGEEGRLGDRSQWGRRKEDAGGGEEAGQADEKGRGDGQWGRECGLSGSGLGDAGEVGWEVGVRGTSGKAWYCSPCLRPIFSDFG